MATRDVECFAARVKDLLHYDPETGIFAWKVERGGRARRGDVAGALGDNGYVRIRIDGKRHQAHRLAWLISTGANPAGYIDHKNGDRSDNRLCNLRDVTRSENAENRQKASKSKRFTDIVGPSFQAGRRQWLVNLRVDGRSTFVGRFKRLADAEAAYQEAKLQHHPAYVQR